MSTTIEATENPLWWIKPSPDVVWCAERNGVLYPYPDGLPASGEERFWAIPCEEVDGVLYPVGEGGERVVYGDRHFFALQRAIEMVTYLLRDRPSAKFFSDIFIYWEEGDYHKVRAPDLCVFPLIDRKGKNWKSVKIWQELSWPVFVMEVLSTEGPQKDTVENLKLYQDEWKTPEYVLCDPREPPTKVWGHRLHEREYVPIEPDEAGRIWSEQLGAWFGVNEGDELQVWDRFGQPIPAYIDAIEQRDEAQRAQLESQRAQQEAQDRIRQLEEELRQARSRNTP